MSTATHTTMQSASGRLYDVLNPSAADVHLPDIAHALSLLCRYGGHCSRFYSVAEHSVLVSHVVPPEYALQGLMHDATEAYVVDVPRPLKRQLTNYADIERRHWLAIAASFGMAEELHPSVHAADSAVLIAERDALMPRNVAGHWPDVPPADVTIIAMSPAVARKMFLDRFAELTR